MEQSLVYGEASTKELMAFMQRPGLSPANKVCAHHAAHVLS